jgi:hypothetical protein
MRYVFLLLFTCFYAKVARSNLDRSVDTTKKRQTASLVITGGFNFSGYGKLKAGLSVGSGVSFNVGNKMNVSSVLLVSVLTQKINLVHIHSVVISIPVKYSIKPFFDKNVFVGFGFTPGFAAWKKPLLYAVELCVSVPLLKKSDNLIVECYSAIGKNLPSFRLQLTCLY